MKVAGFDQLGQYAVAVVGGVGAEVGHRAVVVGEADHAEVFDSPAFIFALGKNDDFRSGSVLGELKVVIGSGQP